jgi:hypothetical protein
LRLLLNPNSVGFLSVPNFNEERLEMEINRIKKGEDFTKDIDPLGHLSYFTPENFRKIIIDSGFSLINDNPIVKTDNKSWLKSLIKRKPVEQKISSTSLFVRAI